MEKENSTTPASSILYECKDCNCQISDRGDGTADVILPNLFADCEACDREMHNRIRILGQQAARQRFNEYVRLLVNGTNASNNIDNA